MSPARAEGPDLPLPPPLRCSVGGQRRGPPASAGGRLLQRRRAAAAAALAWGRLGRLGGERAVGGRGCLGAELTPPRVTGCHLEGRGGWASTRSVFRKGLRELFEWKITKTKRGLEGVAPPLVAAAQLTHCSSSNGSRPSLAPSFLPGCFFNGAATPPPVLRKRNCEVAPPPLPLAPFPARPSNPPLGQQSCAWRGHSPDPQGLSQVAEISALFWASLLPPGKGHSQWGAGISFFH